MNWIDLNSSNTKGSCIVAISDTGLMKRLNGIIEPIPYRQRVRYNGNIIRAYRLLAEHFIPKTEEDISLGRDCVDHITHNPIDMNINDIRNMRWCTHKENLNFEEAKANQYKAQRNRNEDWCRRISESHKGKVPWNKGKKGLQVAWNKGKKGKPSWNKGLHGDEYLSHYKLGRTYNSLLDSPLGG